MRCHLLPILCGTVLAGGCGGDPEPAPQDGASSAASGTAAAGTDLPRPLAEVSGQANELLEGGAPAFEERLSELEGHPVVVNKWASWCDPCRAEFPFFRSQAEKRAGEVAFLGLNSLDNDEAAAEFLAESPVPYPSYVDQDQEVANEVLGGNYSNPATAFFDERGELVYVKQGGYSSEEELAEDIEHYAG